LIVNAKALKKQKYWVTWFFLLLGGGLLTINCVGFLIGSVISNFPEVRKPVPNFDYRTLSWEKAQSKFSRLLKNDISLEQKAKKLFGLVSRSFMHTSSYKIKPWDNWMLWLGGIILDKKYLDSQDPDLLWKAGGGFCHQAATIYVSKGKDLGLETRLIGLSGHVVAEVYLPGKGWRVVDPDMGIFWDHDLDSFGTEPNINQIKNHLSTLGFLDKTAQHFAKVYTSQEDNKREKYPTAPKRYLLEKITNWFKWLIPLILIGVSLRIMRTDPHIQ
jgi:transglutaminase superfamily protein